MTDDTTGIQTHVTTAVLTDSQRAVATVVGTALALAWKRTESGDGHRSPVKTIRPRNVRTSTTS
jgi:hypothetical protein